MSAQILEKNGKPEFAVIPIEEYKKLLELAEDAEDIGAADRVMNSDDEELIPHEIAIRLIKGNEHPLLIWREYRGMTQGDLADKAGIGKSYISQIESGKKPGSVAVLADIAQALDVDIDDIVAK